MMTANDMHEVARFIVAEYGGTYQRAMAAVAKGFEAALHSAPSHSAPSEPDVSDLHELDRAEGSCSLCGYRPALPDVKAAEPKYQPCKTCGLDWRDPRCHCAAAPIKPEPRQHHRHGDNNGCWICLDCNVDADKCPYPPKP